jgi:hypothetical protein
MKTKFQTFAVLLIAALATLFAQGPLTPPGAPAPTMKSLDQIEARTAIFTAPFTIAQSGSYYVSANLNVSSGTAITIAATNVTLDLNGFKISSTAFGGGTGSAILIQSAKNVAIYNGHIEGREVWDNAFLHGINSSNSPINVRVTDVSVFGCGMNGINLGDQFSTVVERCTVDLVGGQGIRAGVVKSSTATRCGAEAIVARTASDCYGQSTNEHGVYASIAQNCYGTTGGDYYLNAGVYAAFTAQGCYGEGARSSMGIFARTAQNCYGASSSGTGVSIVYTAQNCYGSSGLSGIGLEAAEAVGCFGTSIVAGHRYFCGSGPDPYP